ncbi:MAG TPA: hypothetical protein IAC14_04270 [Candidatus Scybalomonas excrementigallinarum]|nr:hypothetical protein [Candidatus Scybalomonas excrementigallinarum]
MIGNVVGGNQDSTFQVLANNAQSIKNSRDSLNSQLSAMTADRDNWMNIANNRLSFKTLTLPISKSGYGASVSGSIAHGCGVTPKYVFGLLNWYGDQDTYLNNFFIANISGITFYIPLAYYTRNFLTLSVDSTTISLSGSSNDTVWSGLPSSMMCYVFY